MANPGIPTSVSHSKDVAQLMTEFNAILINSERIARENRILMAAGSVSDLTIKNVWEHFAHVEDRINEIRRTPDFQDNYARHRGLAYTFNCLNSGSGGDIQAAQDKILNLPTNHKFKTDTRVDFKLIEGTLPGGLSEGTNVWIRTVAATDVTLSATEGGASDINLTGNTGMAEMVANIKPDLANLRTNIDLLLDEIELNLTQRGTTYDRPNITHTYSTYTTANTATLRGLFSDIEADIDVVAA